MFDDWRERHRAGGVPNDEDAVRLHDPLALLALVGEPVVTVERQALIVDERGAVHADSGRGRALEVVTDVDVVRAMERIVDLVTQSGAGAQ
jgi:hypothetical protein